MTTSFADLSPAERAAFETVMVALRAAPADDVEYALRYAVLLQASSSSGESKAHQAALAFMVARAGLSPSLSSTELASGVAEYMRGHPPRSEVVRAVGEVLRKIAASGAPDLRAAAEKLFGRPSFTPAGERAEGAVSLLELRLGKKP